MVASKLRQRVITVTGNNNVYALRIPVTVELPAIAFQRISSVPWSDHEGAAQVTTSRWQFTVIAEKYEDALSVGDSILNALDGWRDSDTPRIERSMLAGDIDNYDPEQIQYRRVLDFFVDHEVE